MFKYYSLDGNSVERKTDDFHSLTNELYVSAKKLWDYPLPAIIDILSQLGKKIVINGVAYQKEGVSYIGMWLRKQNLENIIQINYHYPNISDTYVEVKKDMYMMAQPRGIVCHWVAANIPSLGVFSIVLSLLSKNASLVKIPPENAEFLCWVFSHLRGIVCSLNEVEYSGDILADAIALVSFPGKNLELSSQFSLLADCRVIYGGGEAVDTITHLPTKESCDTIVYGPKYSFGMFDRDFVESPKMEQAISKCIMDVVTFNQMACSSPHVYFIEKSSRSIKEVAEMFAASFRKVPDLLLHQGTPTSIVAGIINKRSYYLLSDDKDAIFPKDASWTILLDSGPSLEEPVFGKTVFLKEVGALDEVLDAITHKVQAVTLCVEDKEKRCAIAKELSYLGVDRVVIPGTSNEYDQPWDGVLSLSRMVRWTIMKE